MNEVRIPYVIKPGDTLYLIAQEYQTTVQDIELLNPGIDPYNLQIGSVIELPGYESDIETPSEDVFPPLWPNPIKQMALMNRMRRIWLEDTFYTSLLINSVLDRLKNQIDITDIMLKTPTQLMKIFGDDYTEEFQNELRQLFTNHIHIESDMLTAMRDQMPSRVQDLERQWYANAQNIARLLSGANPNYKFDDLWSLIRRYLDMTKREMTLHNTSNYAGELGVLSQLNDESTSLADYLSAGLMSQFAQNYS